MIPAEIVIISVFICPNISTVSGMQAAAAIAIKIMLAKRNLLIYNSSVYSFPVYILYQIIAYVNRFIKNYPESVCFRDFCVSE